MKRLFVIFFVALIFFLLGFFIRDVVKKESSSKNIASIFPVSKPLEKYSFDSLSKADIKTGRIVIGDILEEKDNFTSYLFTFEFNPTPGSKETKKTTGMINIPKGNSKYPVIVMFRGFVDQKLYITGMGTKSASYFFADNGFITIAPDYLGYGGSDKEADNIFETRFQTYVTSISLLNTIKGISDNTSLITGSVQTINRLLDSSNLFIWGHSNGGQIALTVLEITGKDISTVLWAPVSKPFPYSILYYTDESEDQGKLIRKELAKFEELYDTNQYSLLNYFERININAKIQIHQGIADDAVPLDWSNSLNKKLKDLKLEVDYFTYPGADHNLQPAWNLATERSLTFFKSQIQ
ncbi:hypothetical protein A2W13_00385 [Candidatus Woesebacteria bacterium RBG_16_36_11]|uniref:Peptidase S9 prolyl oligopeptidase catalytic domain-containing protein n=3 Tax=Candidatus Woeseibacteriota TaxID=1752722 RepID=A0A1F7X737_9BACT|nr:MAG: hypothetical protein A2Z67_00680 [Candidatus Woesebacteria bacterium RBG_13_36_22]OGM10890.1 MAG: hypothetical protein A2W13_00385 [Candidatus Woesebacteria bacterium RBG_16_36_11]OGM16860.1 MAG: hypothetical protein A2V55_02780 [Candidatus Woesebacteria bacterium RBG_19FT_COMBO_37_29]